MNERIQEIAEQQGFTGPNFYISSSELEKFAELIVRDISKMIESQDVDPAFKHRMSWAVKDRYGVKE